MPNGFVSIDITLEERAYVVAVLRYMLRNGKEAEDVFPPDLLDVAKDGKPVPLRLEEVSALIESISAPVE